MKEAVMVTGLGIVSALGIGKTTYLEGLTKGLSGIKEITVFDTAELFTQGGEVSEVTDGPDGLDRASQMLKLALAEALMESGLTPGEWRIGAVVGSAQGGLRTGEKIHHLVESEEKVPRNLWCEYMLHRLIFHINEAITLTGPEVVISNACVSSTMALGVALDAIHDGLADIMIVAGVDCLSRFVSAGFQALTAVTGSLCRPFNKERDGIIPGEGSGVIILEREGIVKRRGARVFAELAGYGSAADAVHMTAPDKAGLGAASAIRQALKEAQMEELKIDYIIPHGTGTSYNDRMECVALESVFGPRLGGKPISSIKATIGHTMGAAGVMSAVAAVLAIQESVLFVNLNFQTPDPEFPFNIVHTPGQRQKNRAVLIMTSAFGGSNAVAVFRQIKNQSE